MSNLMPPQTGKCFESFMVLSLESLGCKNQFKDINKEDNWEIDLMIQNK